LRLVNTVASLPAIDAACDRLTPDARTLVTQQDLCLNIGDSDSWLSTDVINFDVSRQPVGPQALTELVRAVVAASPEDETDWLEWKGPVDLTSKEHLASIAGTILGFANRSPERAARNGAGYAYLILGAEPGNIYGLQRRDPAELDQAIRRLLGSDGPTYDLHWLLLDERDLLVCSVAPPRSGDPIFTPVRTSGHLRAGDVLIRRPGKTEHADHDEMVMLMRRLSARAPADGPDVALRATGGAAVIAKADPNDPRWEQFLRDEVGKYPIRQQRQRSVVEEIAGPGTGAYIAADVERYLDELRSTMPALAAIAGIKNAPGCAISVVNQSDKTYRDLRIKLRLSPNNVDAVITGGRQSFYGRVAWPERPKPVSINDLVGMLRGAPAIVAPPYDVPEVVAGHPGWAVQLPDTTVHARDTEQVVSEVDLVIVLRDDVELPENITVQWTATSPDVDGQAQGTLVLSRLLPTVDSVGLLIRMADESA
jgi:hypothetical protein